MSSVTATAVESGQVRGHAVVLPGQTPQGEYVLSVLLKRTYDIVAGGLCRRAERDRPLNAGDVYWGDPMNSCVRFESDFIPFKLATDVVLDGKAHAPGGIETTSCEISLQVGAVGKKIVVWGDRAVRFVESGLPEFAEPAPFREMELRYELAYGGIDVYSNKSVPYPYPRNPLGRGFVLKNCAKTLDHLLLPNLEDPNALLTPERLCLGDYQRWEEQPQPAGFGWFPKAWLPRAQHAGILPADRAVEQELRQAYAKLIPDIEQREAYLRHGLPDMDFRFFNGASVGLIFPYLKGGEPVVTENLAPEGTLSFNLPTDRPQLGFDIGAGAQEPEVVLHTAQIRMEEREVDMVYRGAVPYPGPDWLPQMRKMDVMVAEGSA
jgi:hypothetical protein